MSARQTSEKPWQMAELADIGRRLPVCHANLNRDLLIELIAKSFKHGRG